MRKLTIEFIREQFEAAGYILLNDKCKGSKQKLKYICPRGHEGNIIWNNWQQGARCAKCDGNKKLTIEFIRNQFEVSGYIFLTTVYINAKQKLDYICPKGHKGSITWDKWSVGHRCLECFGSRKLTIAFIKEQFEKEGYMLLTKKYINAKQKLDYICPKGHGGSICWSHWRQGQRCRQCYLEGNKGSGNPSWNPKLTDEDREINRKYPKYIEWRDTIKERDNFTCRVCGDKKGGNLVSHHIESYTANPELRTELSNGITLCEKCHKDFHHIYGYGNNTRKQFEEFTSRRV